MAISSGEPEFELLRGPGGRNDAALTRTASAYNPLNTYVLPKGENRHYQQQYADMYFARLAQLKSAVESHAADDFNNFTIGNETARRVDRVLDVRQGELCWVIGTCYMEMPLKPNVLEDIGKEHWIVAPPPREKYVGSGAVGTQFMLEDESGRLRLTGKFLEHCLLVTGVIIAVLGTENADGDFEVVDLQVPDLPRQPQRWERDDAKKALEGEKLVGSHTNSSGKVVLVSGLGISSETASPMALDLLLEFLLGESAGPSEQQTASQISRLVIVGNSLSRGAPILSRDEMAAQKKANSGAAANGLAGPRKYGYDRTAYDAAPTQLLDRFLATILPSIPITLIPGETDATATSLPQPPIHAAMFPESRPFMAAPGSSAGWLDPQTNPAEFDVDGWRMLATGGQPLDDVYKYVTSEARLDMMEAMLRWRLSAPTAPDTLWCYPFQDGDAFVIKECPHVFAVGNQQRFETAVIDGPAGQRVRLIAVPRFHETGQIVLLDMESLSTELITFETFEAS